MQAIIIKPNAAGVRRPHPIDSAEAEAMVERGEAVLHRRNARTALYETKVLEPKARVTRHSPGAQAPEDLDSVADEQTDPVPQVYSTKDMVAQPHRRRGRPRKTTP